MNRILKFLLAGFLPAAAIFTMMSCWPVQEPPAPMVSATASLTQGTPVPTPTVQRLPADTAFDAALAPILNIPQPSLQNEALAALTEKWVARDPEATANYARQATPRELADRLMRLVLSYWAVQDFHSALSWAAKLNDEERARAISEVCTKLAERSPAAAVQALVSGHFEHEPSGLLQNLTAQWMERAPSAAFQWLKQQPPGGEHDGLMARAAFVWSKTNPEEAADMVLNHMSPGPEQDEAAISVLHQWALDDLDGAEKWAQDFPEGSLHARAMHELEGVKRQP